HRRRRHVDVPHAVRVLGDHRGDHGHPVPAGGGDRLEIRGGAGAPGGVRPGDREHARQRRAGRHPGRRELGARIRSHADIPSLVRTRSGSTGVISARLAHPVSAIEPRARPTIPARSSTSPGRRPRPSAPLRWHEDTKIVPTSAWLLCRTLLTVDLHEHQAAFLDWLVELVRAEGVDVVVIPGDVYDRAVPSVTSVELLDSALARLAGT